MDLMTLRREIMNLLNSCKTSGNSFEAKEGFNIAIGEILEGLAKPYLKSKETIKERYKDILVMGENILFETSEVCISAKMSAGRAMFDKDAFIRLIVEAYEIPAENLFALATSATKTSANPISITSVVFQKPEE